MRIGFFFSLLMLTTVPASAQWAYWVTESNVNSRGLTVVKVYDFNNRLIAEREIHRKVDITRKREQRMLDRIVRASLMEQAMQARKAKRAHNRLRV